MRVTSSRAMLAMNSKGPSCTSCNAPPSLGKRLMVGGKGVVFGTEHVCGSFRIIWFSAPAPGSGSKSLNLCGSGDPSLLLSLVDWLSRSCGADLCGEDDRTRLSCPSSGIESPSAPKPFAVSSPLGSPSGLGLWGPFGSLSSIPLTTGDDPPVCWATGGLSE